MYQFNRFTFILFEGISKGILSHPILNFAILISFQCEKCNFLALIGGGGSDQITASKKFAPFLAPPPPPTLIF